VYILLSYDEEIQEYKNKTNNMKTQEENHNTKKQKQCDDNLKKKNCMCNGVHLYDSHLSTLSMCLSSLIHETWLLKMAAVW
jgi:hypothetical protein